MIAKVVLAGAVLLSACGGSGHAKDFDEALRSGASCRELFEIRNEVDPNEPKVEEMNERLREVGCFSAGSERTDQ